MTRMVRCPPGSLGHRAMVAFEAAMRNTSVWHRVTKKDGKRIHCKDCRIAPVPAEVCEHVEWNTGNTTGVSFFYYCQPHGIERGFHWSKIRKVA